MAKSKITAKDRKGKQKDVIDMSNAKKKLHEMVESLIGGDSKAAAAALHEYLQQKTRSILGEERGDMDMDFEGGEGGEHDDMDDEFGGEDEFDGEDHDDDEECEHCHGEGCPECEHKEHDHEEGDEFGDEDHDFEDMDDGEEHSEPDFERMHEGNETKATPTFKGAHNNAAKDLGRKVKGTVSFDKTSRSGSKKQNSTEATPTFKGAHNNASKDLGRKVKGNIKFSSSKARKNV